MREILIWIEISERRIIRNDCFMTHILQNCKCTKIQCSIYFITFLCFINFQSTFSFRNFAGSLKLHALYSFYSSWRPLTYVWYHTSCAYNALYITSYFLKISTYRLLNVCTCFYHTSLLITPHESTVFFLPLNRDEHFEAFK